LQFRDILVAQIAEYARHCGQADLLRERIDGPVGQKALRPFDRDWSRRRSQ
jgi:hypothetical protein